MTSPLCQVHDYRANENNLSADELHLFVQRLDISDIYMHEESCNKDKNSILELVPLYSKSYEHSFVRFHPTTLKGRGFPAHSV